MANVFTRNLNDPMDEVQQKIKDKMIEKDIRTNGEFYICPVFNEAIADGKKVRIKEIEKMWGIGTPEDLKYFLENYKA